MDDQKLEALYKKHSGKRIVSAAMLMKDGLVVPGARHFSPDMRAVLKRIYGEGYHLQVSQQGFINSHGEFLNREDAWVIATKQMQIYRELNTFGTLYSENLY